MKQQSIFFLFVRSSLVIVPKEMLAQLLQVPISEIPVSSPPSTQTSMTPSAKTSMTPITQRSKDTQHTNF